MFLHLEFQSLKRLPIPRQLHGMAGFFLADIFQETELLQSPPCGITVYSGFF